MTLRSYDEGYDDACAAMKAEVERLRAAIARIDGINDNPAHYNAEINAVCDTVLRPHLNEQVTPPNPVIASP